MKKLVTLTTLTSLLWSGGVVAKDVRVCWAPPTKYDDGSVLTDLSGYRIEFGLGKFDKAITLTNPGLTCYTILGLTPGTWSIRMFSLSTGHGESVPSSTVTARVLPPPTQGSIEDAGTRTIPPKK